MRILNAILTILLCVISSCIAILAIPPGIVAAALLTCARYFREVSFPDRP